MAIRFSGNCKVSVKYTDRGDYRCSVSCGEVSTRLTVNPPASGYGPGVAYDSPQAYDSAARAAISFAIHDSEDGDYYRPEYNSSADEYIIERGERQYWMNFGDINPREYGAVFVRQKTETIFDVADISGADWDGFSKLGYLCGSGELDLNDIRADERPKIAASVGASSWDSMSSIEKVLAYVGYWGIPGQRFTEKNYRAAMRQMGVTSYRGNVPSGKVSVKV